MLRNSQEAWGSGAKILHWLVVLLVLEQLVGGAWLSTLNLYTTADIEAYQTYVPFHKSVGLTILWVMIVRLVWRSTNRRPNFPLTVPSWQRRAALANHAALYVLLILQPLLGLIQSDAYRAETYYLGLFRIPHFIPDAWSRPNSDTLRLTAQNIHTVVGILIGAAIAVHISAALKHHFVDRDGVLRRMLPRFGTVQSGTS